MLELCGSYVNYTLECLQYDPHVGRVVSDAHMNHDNRIRSVKHLHCYSEMWLSLGGLSD